MWGFIEADFQRDYGMNAADVIFHISWRRFKVLYHGLSSFGTVASNYARVAKEEDQERSEASEGAQQFWSSLMMFPGPGKK